MATLTRPLECYWCGVNLSEACDHIRKGREPLSQERVKRFLLDKASLVDNDFNPVIGFAAEDILGGDAVVWDPKSMKLRRYA